MGREASGCNRGDTEQEVHWVPQQLRRNLELLTRHFPQRGVPATVIGHSWQGSRAPSSGGPDPHCLLRTRGGWFGAEAVSTGEQGSSYPGCRAALGKVGLGCRLWGRLFGGGAQTKGAGACFPIVARAAAWQEITEGGGPLEAATLRGMFGFLKKHLGRVFLRVSQTESQYWFYFP